MQSNRTAALDYLLAIGNLLALYDHKMEHVSNLLEEKLAVPELDATDEEKDLTMNSINEELAQTQADIHRLYQIRQTLQRNFFYRYGIDKDYRCQFKHFAVSLVAAEECYNADRTTQNRTVLFELRREAYQFLGKAMGVGPANCGRCLTDMYDESVKLEPKPADDQHLTNEDKSGINKFLKELAEAEEGDTPEETKKHWRKIYGLGNILNQLHILKLVDKELKYAYKLYEKEGWMELWVSGTNPVLVENTFEVIGRGPSDVDGYDNWFAINLEESSKEKRTTVPVQTPANTWAEKQKSKKK